MAKEVTISALNGRPPATLACSQAGYIDSVMAYWRQEIDRVLPDRPDLVVLPELCEMANGSVFSSCVDQALRHDPVLLDFFSDLCRKHQVGLALPTLRAAGGNLRNSVRMLDRCGNVTGIYDKTYPTLHEMKSGVQPGHGARTIETEFGRVGCLICFDLNFALLREQYARQKPNLLLFSSMYHGGRHVQQAWAYQCRAHLVAAVSNLPSEMLSPLGDRLATTTNYTPYVTARLNLDCCVAHLDGNVEKIEAMKRHYGPQVKVHDPGLLAPVLITSFSREATAREMAATFDIELLDDYFERAVAAREQALHERPANAVAAGQDVAPEKA